MGPHPPTVTPPPYSRGVGIHVTTTAYGAAALDALAAAVRPAKGGDPLAAGGRRRADQHRRRHGPPGARPPGRRSPPSTCSRRSASPSCSGRRRCTPRAARPVSTPVVDLAVRRVVHANPGLYAGVAAPPVDRRRPARPLPRAARRRAPGRSPRSPAPTRGGEPARVAAEVARRCAPTGTTRATCWPRAVDRARRRPARPAPPGRRPPAPSGCARSSCSCWRPSASAAPSRSSLGLTGDAARRRRRRWPRPRRSPAGPLTSRCPAALRAGGPLEVVSTTDADDEVRIAVRAVVDAARARHAGSTASPCCSRPTALRPPRRAPARRRPACRGTAGRAPTVDERMVPRVLAELLDLDRRGLRRSDLMTLLADVPARRRRRRRRADGPLGARRAAPPASCARPTGRRTCRAIAAEPRARTAGTAPPTPTAADRACWRSSTSCRADLGDPARDAAVGARG